MRFWRKKEVPLVGAELGETTLLEANEAEVPAQTRGKGVSRTPFLNARRSFNTMNGQDQKSRRDWQIMGTLGLLLGIAGIAANVYQASQSTYIPYVIQVDKLGQTAAVGAATYAGKVEPIVVQTFLAAFISNVRMVTPDTALQRQSIFNVYSMLAPNDAATQKIGAYYAGEDEPFKRAAKELVEIQITNAPLPLTRDSWQLDWTETVRERTATKRPVTSRMRAVVQVYLVKPNRNTTEENMRRNPIGIFVKDLTWSKQMDPLEAGGKKP